MEIELGTNKVQTLFRGLLLCIPPRFRNIILTLVLRFMLKISSGNVFGAIYNQRIRITDAGIFAAIIHGTWESHVVRYFCDSVEEGMTVIDVGARRGIFSLIGASLVGASGYVLAFEPVPQFASELQFNAKINGYQNIKVYEVALSNQDGMIELYLDKGCCGSFAEGLTDFSQTITVNVNKFDSLRVAEVIERATVVKIDVEGAEYQVIEGMKTMLSSSDFVTIFCECHPIHLHKLGYNVEKLFDLLKNLGLCIEIIEEDGKLNKNYNSVFNSKTNFHIKATK